MIHPKYRPDIDGLRAFAVISVLVFHIFPEYLPGGFIGVDIFFVISGFLICTIIFENLYLNSFSFIDFYSRRIRRIFPALIAVLISSWVVAWYTLLPEEFALLGKHILSGASFVSNLVLWGESGYFDTSSSTKPLLHLWSLGIEEQFYLFWPFLMWVGYRLRMPLILLTVIILIASFILNLLFIHQSPSAVFYSPITRVWELLFGAVLAWIFLPKNEKELHPSQRFLQTLSVTQKNGCAFFGGLLLVTSLVLIAESSLFPGWWALLPVTGTALVILAGPRAWVNRHLLSSKAMVWFGLISFPLYLWHWPLVSFVRIIDGDVSSIGVRLFICALSIFLAWLTHYFVEKPLLSRATTKYKNIKSPVIWCLVMLMCLVGYMGYAAYVRDGIPIQRMLFRSGNPLLNEILVYKFQTGAAWRMGSCYLTENQDAENFKYCPENIERMKPTIFLWGDSHAAHLYPGLEANYSNDYNIVQRTASACPPILGLNKPTRPHCKKINDEAFDEIKKLRPDSVVLAGNWRDNQWQDLTKTIKALKNIGIHKIDLVGPVPVWENNLPKQIFLYCKKNAACSIPMYMKMGLVNQVFDLDKLMSHFAKEEEINYLSPIAVLCEPEGCLIRTGDRGNTITAWDSEHLTDAGARYLVFGFKKSMPTSEN